MNGSWCHGRESESGRDGRRRRNCNAVAGRETAAGRELDGARGRKRGRAREREEREGGGLGSGELRPQSHKE